MEVELGPPAWQHWQRQHWQGQGQPVMDPTQRQSTWARPSAFAAPPLPFNAPLQVETEAPRDEARQSFLDLGHDGRHGHRVPWRQYVSLAVWYLLLVMEYIVVRIVCQFDIPRDCKPHGDLDTIFDLQVMFMMGFMLAILTGVHMPDRFAYLFCFKGPRPRGIAFLLVMVVSGPVWGSLDTIDSLSRISFTSSFFEESFVNVLIGLAFGAAAAFLLLWHFYCAFMHNQISGFLAYTGSRLSIWIFYGVYLYIAATTTNVEVHLHHYVIGFLIAILAEFNHPISLVVLAAGTGIFVQGISAYHADALTEEKKHLLALFF